MSVTTAVHLLAEEAAEEGGSPAWIWGVGALVLLLALLTAVWMFGRGQRYP
jgi:hypothetical protein